MSLINLSLEHVYCSNLVSNHVLISLIRFVSRFTVHLCNAIYFSTIFSTPCKRFTKILRFVFTTTKHGLSSYSCRVYFLATQAVGKEIGAASSYGGEDCGRHHDEQGCYAFFLMLLYVLSI